MWQPDEDGPAVGPQVLFGIDSTGRCTLSIGTGLKDLGREPGELVGQNLFEVYGKDQAALRSLRRVLTGETFSVEREFDGRRLAVYYQPLFDDEGTVTGAMGVSTDVTEQRRVEGEARAARQRASLLADVSASLTREVLDVEALLRVAVGVVTDAVAEVGAVWFRPVGTDRLEPGPVWHVEAERRASLDDWRSEAGPPAQLDLRAVEQLATAQVLDLGAVGDVAALHGSQLAWVAKTFGVHTGLRVPLRSRGLLVGVLDLARGASHGPFTDEETGLVADIAERCALALDNALLLSAHRQAREQLVKFQALADASDDLIGITDLEGRLTYSNPRVHEAGVEISDEGAWTTLARHTPSSVTQAVRTGLETEGRWSGDLTGFVLGEEVVAHLDAFRLSHPDTGADLGIAWIAQDVTELRGAEAALRAANADLKQFKALVEASPDFIAIAGLDARVKYVNPLGRELIGMDPNIDVTTTVIADYLTPQGLEASELVEQPAVLAHGHWEGESTLHNHRGPAIPVAIASFLMHDAETGEPFALATVQRDISERRTAETALRELADQRQALLTRLVEARDAERARIAADVHDDPVQALAAVDLRLGLLRRQLRERAPELLETLEPLQTTVTGATDRLRALLFDLEPPDLERGLTQALRLAAAEIFESTTTRWTADCAQEPDVPDATRAIAYRIAKEAMINARKHAGARHVVVHVAERDGGLEVSVADDGVGLGPEPIESSPGHRGLFTMQDRAAAAGGRCVVGNRAEGGTQVTVWLPGPSPV